MCCNADDIQCPAPNKLIYEMGGPSATLEALSRSVGDGDAQMPRSHIKCSRGDAGVIVLLHRVAFLLNLKRGDMGSN
jgi:hypothetical protein